MIDIDGLTAKSVDQLKDDEGFRARPYFCSRGKLTIGYGWNLESDPMRVVEAEYRLKNDVLEAIADIARSFPWFKDLDIVRQSAMVNLRFNLGLSGLYEFRRFLDAMKRGDYAQAEAELIDSEWHNQVGARAARIEAMIREG